MSTLKFTRPKHYARIEQHLAGAPASASRSR